MDPKYSFFAITRDSISQFVDLYVTVFNSAPWSDGWTQDAVRERFESFSTFPTFFGLGCITHNQRVGLIFGWSERWTNGWHFQTKEMGVAREFQGKRLGTEMMQAFEYALLEHAVKQTYLQTGENAPARNFYESLGYKTISLVSMSKKLGQNSVGKNG